jgi:hypothetical protein
MKKIEDIFRLLVGAICFALFIVWIWVCFDTLNKMGGGDEPPPGYTQDHIDDDIP